MNPSLATATATEFGFDENDRYDIYFASDLVQGVKVLGTKEINGEVFLIVSTSNARNRETEGFILFRSVAAILPTSYFNTIQRPGGLYNNKY